MCTRGCGTLASSSSASWPCGGWVCPPRPPAVLSCPSTGSGQWGLSLGLEPQPSEAPPFLFQVGFAGCLPWGKLPGLSLRAGVAAFLGAALLWALASVCSRCALHAPLCPLLWNYSALNSEPTWIVSDSLRLKIPRHVARSLLTYRETFRGPGKEDLALLGEVALLSLSHPT